LNESVTDGNCPWWLTESAVDLGRRLGDGAERHLARRLLARRCASSASGSARYCGLHLEDDVVLVELGEVVADLALAERVVERVVDVAAVMPRRDAVSRSMVTSS
jgi:hypothetical protein